MTYAIEQSFFQNTLEKKVILDYREDTGRKCSQCDTWQEWDFFNKKPKGINGRNSICKSCLMTKNKSRYKKKTNKKIVRHTSKLVSWECDSIIITEIDLGQDEQKKLNTRVRDFAHDILMDYQ